MKYTVIGDIHAKPNNLQHVTQLFEIIEQLGNPTILLGDLLDTKEVIRGRCLNTYIKLLSQSKLQFYILVGNHDYFNLDCKEHALEALNMPNVKIVDQPFVLLEDGERVAKMLPYIHDPELMREELKKPRLTLFCHADVVGFDYGNGVISDQGISYRDFNKFKRVVSGHYHKYQEKGNFTYLGTPFSHSFGEANQDKYIAIWNSDDNSLELIETDFPKHLSIEINADETSTIDVLPLEKHEVRIILKGSPEAIKAFKKPKDVKVIEMPIIKGSSIELSEDLSPAAQFSDWAKKVKNLNKRVVDLGLEVLKNVQ